MIGETFLELLKDPAHWAFELFLMLLFDVVIGLLLWPAFKRWLRRHDKKVHEPKYGPTVYPSWWRDDSWPKP